MRSKPDGTAVSTTTRPRTKQGARRQLGSSHDGFPLRTVTAMTGLTPDLIRAWEKRYAVVAPIRGARGARLYTSADIAHLRLLARVVGAGRAIGDVAGLSSAQLEQLVGPPPAKGQGRESRGIESSHVDFVTRILDQLERFDHAAVRRLLGDAIVSLGVGSFVHEVALPLVQRVGARWADGDLSIAEEHLSTGVLRNLLAGLLEGRSGQGRPILLATPSGEQHEIGLLLVALLARDAGASVVSLGVDLPAADIVTAAARTQARVVGLSLVGSGNRARATNEIQAIHDALPARCELWLGGADAREVAAGVKAFRGLVLETLQAAETELARITPGIAAAHA